MDDTGVSAKHLPMLGRHGLLQALYYETWSSLCFHATARLNASFKGASAMACGHRNSCHCTTQHKTIQHNTCQWL
jgi:hypothetical protein